MRTLSHDRKCKTALAREVGMNASHPILVTRTWPAGAWASLETDTTTVPSRSERLGLRVATAVDAETTETWVRYRAPMARPSEDWRQVLDGFEKNDPLCVAKITDVIVGYLHHYRAYDRRSSWDDLCQDVLMALLRTVRRDGLRDPGAFIKYAGTITRNKLANFAQRKDPKERSVSLDDMPESQWATEDRDDAAARPQSPRSDVLMDLDRALEVLPERCRKVVESIYVQGYSYQETAERLSMSLSAVKRDQIHGLKALRAEMGIES